MTILTIWFVLCAAIGPAAAVGFIYLMVREVLR